MLDFAGVLKNEFVDRWKEKGKPVIGYACIAFPKEIAFACGILPFRLRGAENSDTSIADSYLSRYNCSVCRSCLDLVLRDEYSFLDGFVRVRGCDHWMGTFDEIMHAKKPEFMHYLKVPHVVRDYTIEFFADEIRRLKEELEKTFNVEVSDDDVVDQVEIVDAQNEKLKKLYEKRFEDSLAGSDFVSLLVLRDSVSADDFEEILSGFEARNVDCRVRVLLSGSPLDEISIIREMESMGANIVFETTCFGAGAFWNMDGYDGEKDIYEFLAERYLKNLRVCARMFGEYGFRRAFVERMFKTSNAEGVILQHNKFCDLFGIENAKMRMDLENKGVPTLLLEKEYASSADVGRIKTRVQAFVERVEGMRSKER